MIFCAASASAFGYGLLGGYNQGYNNYGYGNNYGGEIKFN